MWLVARRPSGMLGFSLVCVGQLVSLTGSGLTQFALMLWVWRLTGSATALALVGVCSFAPLVALSPIAGALVDRWNRKLVMMLSDLGAGVSTLLVLLLYSTGTLEIWHLYLTAALAGASQSFQWPAYSAAISSMLPKQQYGRANGMLSLSESLSAIAAPILAGVLLALIDIGGILLLDIVSFLFAIAMLLLVRVPQPERTPAGREGSGSLWQESLYGFRYILRRRSLLGLQLVFLGSNLVANFSGVVLVPMILARTGDNAQALSLVLAAGGVGGVAGGLVMSLWGGPRRRVHGVLGGLSLAALCGTLTMGLSAWLPVWIAAAFLQMFLIPITNGSNQSIWQAKVAPDVQGRVFAARRMISWLCVPLAQLLGGPTADYLLEPAMRPDGALVGLFGGIVGSGPGAGMALMMVVSGLLGTGVALAGYLVPAVRDAELLLPDHDAPPSPAPSAGAQDELGPQPAGA